MFATHIKSIKELDEWDGQSPPTARTFKGKPVVSLQDVVGKGNNTTKEIPNFGPYIKEKQAEISKSNLSKDTILGDNKIRNENRPTNVPDRKVPSVDEVIGRALDYIGTYNDLDNRYAALYQ